MALKVLIKKVGDWGFFFLSGRPHMRPRVGERCPAETAAQQPSFVYRLRLCEQVSSPAGTQGATAPPPPPLGPAFCTQLRPRSRGSWAEFTELGTSQLEGRERKSRRGEAPGGLGDVWRVLPVTWPSS